MTDARLPLRSSPLLTLAVAVEGVANHATTSLETLLALADSNPQELCLTDISRPLGDAEELTRALAKLLEGQTLQQAFGAPGDWGYSTAIGKALVKVYRTPYASSRLAAEVSHGD